MKKERKCKICGHAVKGNYTVIVKQNNKKIGTYNVCEMCLEHNCLINPNLDESQEKFEETFGNPYIGSDFI